MSDVYMEKPAQSVTELTSGDPASLLRTQLGYELDLIAEASGKSYVYQNSQAVDHIFGAEYGDRTVVELIQNAHDAHSRGDAGEIRVDLHIAESGEGTLFVANRGLGFSWANVQAIRNVAMSSKPVGEGIGNKGLGFRSVENLTSDPQIFSQLRRESKDAFDGFCFRFLSVAEVDSELRSRGLSEQASGVAASGVSRYLMAAPIERQPPAIREYASNGFASVVVLPLRSESAIARAQEQVRALLDEDAPIMLFLERLESVTISISDLNGTLKKKLLRRVRRANNALGHPEISIQQIDLGEQGTYVLARAPLDRNLLLEAITASIDRSHVLRNWLNWEGEANVAIAVPLKSSVARGRLYNFLPMGTESASPMRGHLDAPFFAHVDRRDADLNLPLNRFLIRCAADLAVTLALRWAGTKATDSVPRTASLDVLMWDSPHLQTLQDAFYERDMRLADAPIVPVVGSRNERRWSSLNKVVRWPERDLAELTALRMASVCGAPILARELRAEEVETFAKQLGRSTLLPVEEQLGDWLEAFTIYLLAEDAKPVAKRWRSFYDDVPKLFQFARLHLKTLAGRRIFLERRGRLGAAGQSKSGPLFVRSKIGKKKDGPRYPPAALTRKMRLLDESIVLDDGVQLAFVQAELLRSYDPIAVLREIRSALTGSSVALFSEAMTWAFEVWRNDRESTEAYLAGSGLRVPSQSGWLTPEEATFSTSWTDQGTVLEMFLDEAAALSEDCRDLRNGLLLAIGEWPSPSAADNKKAWLDFLEVLGVQDGLRSIDADGMRNHTAAPQWRNIFTYGRANIGMDRAWLSEVRAPYLAHPNSIYQRRGRIARLPGQLQFNDFSETARNHFFRLTLTYLRKHGTDEFTFSIGRYERLSGAEDEQPNLPTPLAAFIRHGAWLRFEKAGDACLLPPSEGWGSRTRGRQPPKFVPHLETAVAEELSRDPDLSKTLFDASVGLLDWFSPMTAVERLRALADAFPSILANERSVFRREYLRSWREVASEKLALPMELPVVVNRDGRDVIVDPNVVVAPSEQSHPILIADVDDDLRVRVLSDAGYGVLAVSAEAVTWAVDALAANGRDVAAAVDVPIALVVDGIIFHPNPGDPLLIERDLAWLLRVLRIAHETMAVGFERGNVHIEAIVTRMRTVRVRFCQEWHISVGEHRLGPTGRRIVYGFAHPDHPTLIVPGNRFDWNSLLSATTEVSKLLNSQIQSFEACMLYLQRLYSELRAPTDEELAIATGTDVEIVRMYQAEVDDAFTATRRMAAAIVAYNHGTELGLRLRDADEVRDRLQLQLWLQSQGVDSDFLDEALREVDDENSPLRIQEVLNLDFGRYNKVLKDLNLPALNDEDDLRAQFVAFLANMRAEILAAIRAAHLDDFLSGRGLEQYLARKAQTFITFNEAWVNSVHSLDFETVAAYVRVVLRRELGVLDGLPLMRFDNTTLDANRRTARSIQSRLANLVGAWSDVHNSSAPGWVSTTPNNIVPILEDAGVLDFTLIKEDEIPALLSRIGAWPLEMPTSTMLAELGLTDADVDGAIARREREREERRRVERSIAFAGTSLDTDAPDFVTRLVSLAEASFDPKCFTHLRTRALEPMKALADHRASRSGPGRPFRGGRGLSDGEKISMGLVSEWLAYQYLKVRHKGFVNEDSWISSNGRTVMGGTANDDTAGYDFRVVDSSGTIWLYEVKSSLEDLGEFEFTPHEMAVATDCRSDRKYRYRILYVPFVFSPERWTVQELPNPMGDAGRGKYRVIGRALRMQFDVA